MAVWYNGNIHNEWRNGIEKQSPDKYKKGWNWAIIGCWGVCDYSTCL